ncbi:MAG: recombinase RecA [Cyanobacteria bacterium NC_groundwater_1444_Ag_S-0.65um_54_12]|nr:recombinase RecA [Cyanobacteria bacterium NC_groundwater_1444_Ag_S-0.65um_54_12]
MASKETTSTSTSNQRNGGLSAEGVLTEKQRAIELAVGSIEKQFGKGSIMKLGDNARMRVAVIPTGILPLDVALGVGGLPRGRVIEVYGPESGGKTTVSLQAVAQVQRSGGIAAFIDAEHALDPAYARNLGVDIDNLLVAQPDTGEQALEIAEALVRSSAVDLIVVDSVAALVPKAELEGEMGDSHVGLQARLMSQALRKLTAAIGKSASIVIFINQLREKVGIMYGNPEITTGGRALRFYASVRIEVRRIEALKKDGVEIGNRVKIKVVKNKVSPPFRIAEFDLLFKEGISREGCVLDIATEMGLVVKNGSWFSYGDNRIGQGREGSRLYLLAHPELTDELEQLVRVKLSLINSETPPETEE